MSFRRNHNKYIFALCTFERNYVIIMYKKEVQYATD